MRTSPPRRRCSRASGAPSGWARSPPGMPPSRTCARSPRRSQLTGATLGRLAEGGNAAGAYLAGAIPHRLAGARAVAQAGLNARDMLESPLRAYLLLGGLEPSLDALVPQSLRTLARAEFVVAATPFASEEIKRVAHL